MSSPKKSVTIALIGCGAAAERFYISPLVAHSSPDFKIILVDLDEVRAAELANAIGAKTARSITQAAEMGAQGAILATPHHVHHAQAVEAMELGLDLLIEKPVTITAADAIDIRNKAAALGRVVMVNNNRRLFPANRAVAMALAADRIGTIKSVVVEDGSAFEWPTKSGFYLTTKEARGVLLDRGAHTVDILSWWLNGPMTVLRCQHDGFEGADALVRLSLSGPEGAIIALRFSRLGKLDNAYHLIGTKGEIRGRLFTWNKYEEKIGNGPWTEVTCNKNSPTNYDEFVVRITGQFIAYLKNGTAPDFTIADVIPSIEVLDAAYTHATTFDLPWYAEWKAL